MLLHTSTNRSTSDAFVVQPMLTRMAFRALSSPTPIAFSTWLACTLPDEQAAPALTETAARSKAITCVSAATPGIPMHDVFGSRAAGAPYTGADGHIASRRRSNPSRSAANLPLSSRRAAAWAAAPKPTTPKTFSLPARRPRS
jgi:hypothetical protein